MNKVVKNVSVLLLPKSLGKLYVDTTVSKCALDTIKMLKAKRGWIWKGEYYIAVGEPAALEVLMYNTEGAPRIVFISENGDLKYFYQMGDIKFWAC